MQLVSVINCKCNAVNAGKGINWVGRKCSLSTVRGREEGDYKVVHNL